MSGLHVVEPGLQTLIVDAGRFGSARLGLPRSGAADLEGLRLANALCRNGGGEAALELTVRGPVLRVEGGAVRIGVGGDVELWRERHGSRAPLPPWRTHTLEDGDLLGCGAVHGAPRAILAVAGGIAVPRQLQSRSVSLRGGLTGLLARPLRAGDLLEVRDGGTAGPDLCFPAPPDLPRPGLVRLLHGPQAGVLDSSGRRTLMDATWTVTTVSDRTALRLAGPRLGLAAPVDVAPQGCAAGSIQVTGDGMPLILGPDRGTTGGYAIAAVVAGVDLAGLGRLRPGAELRFALLDPATALDLRRARLRELDALVGGIRALPPTTLPPT